MRTINTNAMLIASPCGLHRQGNQRAQHSIPNISSMPTTVVGSSFCHHGLWTKLMLDAKAMPLHGLPQQVVEERFGIFGGTARFVLRTDENLVQKDRERLEGALNSADALSTLEISSDMKAISKNTHLLVKMYPKRNFSFFDVNVSSPYVCQELVKRNWQKRRKALWERIEEGRITGIGLFALFEEAFHQFMQDQKLPKVKLRARRLTRDGTQSDTTVGFTGGLDGVLITGNPKPVIEAGKYYQPTTKQDIPGL